MTLARPSRSLVIDLALAAVFGVTAWLCLALARPASPVAIVWLPNALLVGVMIQSRAIRWRLFALSDASLLVAALLGTGLTAAQIAIRSSINMAEVLIIVVGMQRIGRVPGLDSMRQLGRFTFLSVVTPATLSLLIVGAFWSSGAVAAIGIAMTWAGAHALGLLLLTPLVCVVHDAVVGRHEFLRARRAETILFTVVALVLAVLLFSQSRYPLLFMSGPVVMLASLRFGRVGATLAVALLDRRQSLT